MDRRAFVAGTVGVLATPPAARGQTAGEVRRVAYFFAGSAAAATRPIAAFRQGLRELGSVEGQSIVIDYRSAEGSLERLPDIAAEVVRLKPDVIVAGPTPAAVAAKNASSTIPIVMWAVGDPVGLGLVGSLARPGGNVTGLSFSVGSDNVVKALELLKEIVPRVRRVSVLSNPANPAHPRAVDAIKAAAPSLGAQLQVLEARDRAELDVAFVAMAKERAGAVVVLTDTVFLLHRARLVDLAARNRLPSMHGLRDYVESGGLMSYGTNGPDLFRRAARFVDRILKGTKPADLPVEQPTTFELVINLRTAKALGLTIPPAVLARADEVIQ
jgi:putative ABC transport system substrate-binding protein